MNDLVYCETSCLIFDIQLLYYYIDLSSSMLPFSADMHLSSGNSIDFFFSFV